MSLEESNLVGSASKSQIGPLASDPHGLSSCLDSAQDGMAQGRRDRSGPLIPGGPERVRSYTKAHFTSLIPEVGCGDKQALYDFSRYLATYAADPNDPRCMGHLQSPTLAVAVAADMVASALNQSMDSWDQAPGAVLLETRFCHEMAEVVYPEAPVPDAIATTGATESNLIAILLAREKAKRAGVELRLVFGENSHHSVSRSAWIVGVTNLLSLKCKSGQLDMDAAIDMLSQNCPGTHTLLVATAGTTDAGCIDPILQMTDLAEHFGYDLHIDAAYAGPLVLCSSFAEKLEGLERSTTVAIDFHKLGWQPVACGLLVIKDQNYLQPLQVRTEYLNSADDVVNGFPDQLGRSIRTSRRPDLFKLVTTLQAVGRQGFESLVAACFESADMLAETVMGNGKLRLWYGPRDLTTVLFRPTVADAPGLDGDFVVAEVRRRLLRAGRTVLGRARMDDQDGQSRLWLKMTILNPNLTQEDVTSTLLAVTQEAHAVARELR